MPSGGGLSYDHSKLTEVIGDFVKLRNVGDIFLMSDITAYISTVPMKKYAKRRHYYATKRYGGNRKPTFTGSVGRLSMIEKSEPYFATIIRKNARKWNLRFGDFFANPTGISLAHNKEGYIESAYSARYCILYCKTDNLGSFFCVDCGKALLLRPQWAYLTKKNKPKVIRKAIKCNGCWDKYDLVKIDHTQHKRSQGGAPYWKLKDRYRHWTGEEE